MVCCAQGHELSGRALRLNFAENFSEDERKARRDDKRGAFAAGAAGAGKAPVGKGAAINAAVAMAALLGSGASGAGQDRINATLAAMSRTQLFEVMAQVRGVAPAMRGWYQ